MLDKIKALHTEIESLNAADAAEVEVLRIKYLSKKGEINALFNDFRALGPDEKRAIGAPLNELKTFATDKINALREALDNNGGSEISIDRSRTAAPVALGPRHP
ncbi:MAG: phenylalanine--tRNA ligase subunit alpha, partial [Muribaculum sp.]|nr:phenylalanine--tRNA ligase subunit alpha [Muribaculum sp.]